MKIKFIAEREDREYYPDTCANVIMESVSDPDLETLITDFECFLKACGYYVKDGSQLDFIEEYQEEEEEYQEEESEKPSCEIFPKWECLEDLNGNRKNFECSVTELFETGSIKGVLTDDNLISIQHRIDEFIDNLKVKDHKCIGAYIGDVVDTRNNKVIIKGWEIKL